MAADVPAFAEKKTQNHLKLLLRGFGYIKPMKGSIYSNSPSAPSK